MLGHQMSFLPEDREMRTLEKQIQITDLMFFYLLWRREAAFYGLIFFSSTRQDLEMHKSWVLSSGWENVTFLYGLCLLIVILCCFPFSPNAMPFYHSHK